MKITLEEWMKQNGKSINKFAEELHCSRVSVINWRKGKVKPLYFFRDKILQITNNEVDI